MLRFAGRTILSLVTVSMFSHALSAVDAPDYEELSANFAAPPKTARPGVYWYFMDGNYSRDGITRDLEAMRDAGIGYVVFLEVNVGIPRGKIDFMSDEWLDMFRHIVSECERCDIQMILGIGPGWTGSGGPWVKGEQSMRHLVSSSRDVEGGGRVCVKLDKPSPRKPFFGERTFPPKMRKDWDAYYEDVCVLAFPASATEPARVAGDADEKAHVYRAPYSSPQLSKTKFVRAHMDPSVRPSDANPPRPGVSRGWIMDISDKMKPDGTLEWEAPAGRWTVMRFGARNNGAASRPAPLPGVGMECDKFDDEALAAHFSNFTDRLFAALGPRPKTFGGIRYLHADSWEVGAQNWTGKFREEFMSRRGYDPKPFYPVMSGIVVDDEEISERFLWDLRRTSQELIIEKHMNAIKKYARRHGCLVSCEPYDMNPIADLELACASDVPMAEFWTENFGTRTDYTLVEAASAANLLGQRVVPAEAFTANRDAWRPHPASMKNQTDWSLAMGVNRHLFHTFQHQCLSEDLKPGMAMGPFGVHWDRNQTWWPMVHAYHAYLSRCQYVLQQGRTVADVLYLAPENAPHVFLPPASALDNPRAWLPDRKGYNFDGCPPSMLFKASVKGGSVTFPGGATYRLLVLPDYTTMTPELLGKVRDLVLAGATVVGVPPRASPGLTGYPACDTRVRALADELWGGGEHVRSVGKGTVVREAGPDRLYPRYDITSGLLAKAGVLPDFESSTGNQRYTHRTSSGWDVYFVSSRSAKPETARCSFRVSGRIPEVWNPLTGEKSSAEFSDDGRRTHVELSFAPHQSFLVVFPAKRGGKTLPAAAAELKPSMTIKGPWKVSFTPPVGKPFSAEFPELSDWTSNKDPAIKYFSGTATYTATFDVPCAAAGERLFISLGKVKVMARVWVNGKDLGVQWTDPWRVEVTGLLKTHGNVLRVDVANLWTNRLVGDESLPYDGPVRGQWPQWLVKGEKRPSPRTTFAAYRFYSSRSPLEPSGLIGPVLLQKGEKIP